ncbi:hypothetical protein A2U01_0018762, partial [Trifolium medium]|nr:hypothetical protein [Trifolium medium]
KSGVKLKVPDGAVTVNKVINRTWISFATGVLSTVMLLTPPSGIRLVIVCRDFLVTEVVRPNLVDLRGSY